MKKILLAVAAAAVMFAGCTKELEQRVDALEKGQADLQEQIDALKEQVSGVKTIVDALNSKVYVSKVEELENGYKISFTNGTTATISDGAKGDKGDTGEAGATPVIGLAEIDGVLYWTVNGEPLLVDGEKVPAVGPKGENGESAPVPSFEINAEGHLIVTINGVATDLGDVTGENGTNGDSWFTGVTPSEDGTYYTIGLTAGGEIVLPAYVGFNITFEEMTYEGVFEGDKLEVPYVIEGDAENTVVRAYACEGWAVAVDRTKAVLNVTVGAGSGYVDVYAINNVTGEIKARSLSFEAGAVRVSEETEYYALAAGGTVEIPVSKQMEYTVSTGAEWLTYTETKAVVEETIVLTAEANETGSQRTATVELKVGDVVAATINVVQRGYYPALLDVQWEETFDLYKNENDVNDSAAEPDATYKNEFTIELSADPAKGTYVLKNFLYSEMYYNNNVAVNNQGGEYYANVEGTTLTVLASSPVMSYGFLSADKVFTLDVENLTITRADALTVYSYKEYDNVYLANYVAKEKKEEVSGDSTDPLIGTWTSTYEKRNYNSTVSTTTTTSDFIIAESDDESKGQYLITLICGLEPATMYATLEGDKLTTTTGALSPALEAITFTYTNDGTTMTLTADASFSQEWMNTYVNFVATKAAPVIETEPADPFIGTWTSTYEKRNYNSSVSTTTTTSDFIIAESDDESKGQYLITLICGLEPATMYATLEGDKLTTTTGALSPALEAITFTYTNDGTTMTLTADASFSQEWMNTYVNFVATKAAPAEGGEEGGSTASYTLDDVIGDWKVTCYCEGSSDATVIDLTIEASDNETSGNVMLSVYPHYMYYTYNMVQYATFDTTTGVLSMPMGQKVAMYWNSGLQDASGSWLDGPFEMQMSEDKSSMTTGEGLYLVCKTGSGSVTGNRTTNISFAKVQ